METDQQEFPILRSARNRRNGGDEGYEKERGVGNTEIQERTVVSKIYEEEIY